MKTITILGISALSVVSLRVYSQVEVDKIIDLTGTSGQRMITNLEAPVNGTDAVNKDYVDAAVAATGGGQPTEVSTESSGTYSFGAAMRYCNGLSEGGHSDWYLPKTEDLMVVISKGGVTVSSNASTNYVWTIGPVGNRSGYNPGTVQSGIAFRFSDGDTQGGVGQTTANKVRCVR